MRGSKAYSLGDVIKVSEGTGTFNAAAVTSVAGAPGSRIPHSGIVLLPDTSHGLNPDDMLEITGSTNYSGFHNVHSETDTNNIGIKAAYIEETLAGTETWEHWALFKCVVAHTSGGGNPAPSIATPTANWVRVYEISGPECTLTASTATFNSNMVNGLFKLLHPRNQLGATGTATADVVSKWVPIKGDWTMKTSGDWGATTGSATFELQRTDDRGDTIEVFKTWKSDNTQNGNFAGTESENGVLYRIVCYNLTSGTLNWELYPDSTDVETIVKITTYTSTTVVECDVLSTNHDPQPTALWCQGAWSADKGYPRSIAFFENRLCFGG